MSAAWNAPQPILARASVRKKPWDLARRMLANSTPDARTGCWTWHACRTNSGYGQASWASKRVLAHRASYEVFVGPIPEGMQIDHLCRNKLCVNPNHLEPVGQSVNVRRARPDTCPQGHAYDFFSDKGYRRCRECWRVAARRYWHKKHGQVAS